MEHHLINMAHTYDRMCCLVSTDTIELGGFFFFRVNMVLSAEDFVISHRYCRKRPLDVVRKDSRQRGHEEGPACRYLLWAPMG